MREYKFRGKRRYDGEWVYGGIEKEGDSYFILTEESAVCAEEGGEIVIQETIGQYIGLKDKNGFEIYEGDFVKWGEDKEKIFLITGIQFSTIETSIYQVIGNKWDNPELLQEVEK